MFGAQGGNMPPWQQVHNQAPSRNGPPPAKKAKGNPIITHYPPPPGYQGPAHPQGPYQQQTWQQPHAAYNHGQRSYSGHPPQAYGYTQPYNQSQWQTYYQQQSNGYAQSYYQQQSWPAHQQSWQGQATAATPHPQSAPPRTWKPSDAFEKDRQRRQSEPFVTSIPGYAGPVDGVGEPVPPESPPSGNARDLEDDFGGECYFLRHPEEINPDLSLGEVEWYPALLAKHPLPSTVKDLEVEIIAPRKSPPAGEDSVSEYFYRDKREETLISVRLTDEWRRIKEDVIFKEFSHTCKHLLSKSELVKKYKDRRDPTWLEREPSATPEAEVATSQNGANDYIVGGDVEIGRRYSANDDASSQAASEDGDVLGNLEQALQRNTSRPGRHSRANSTTSISSNHSTKLRPLMPVRDRAQDDILKTLGVTGSPKMVYQTPGPAIGAPPPQREGSVSRDQSRRGSTASNSGIARGPPPPLPGQPLHDARRNSFVSKWDSRVPGPYAKGSYGSRRDSNASGYNSGASRPGSRGSQHTGHGSDYGYGDEERTPRPKFNRTDSRKRGYDDYDGGYSRERERYEQDDDATPKQQRYKQPRVGEWHS